MSDDDLTSSSTLVLQGKAGGERTAYAKPGDDLSTGTTNGSTKVGSRGADGELTTVEVAGDAPVPGGESTESAGTHEEVSADGESAGEFVEATPEQLAAESGEESAVSDLRGLEGFEESIATGSESSAGEAGLTEAGEAMAGETAEFLPLLASLVPTLVSAVGPVVAKGIAGRLSPRASRALTRVPRPGAVNVKPGSMGALLAQVAQLIKTMQSRPGSESGTEAVDETAVTEAVAVLEVILGTDDRIRIQNTRDIPWRRICALRITFPTGAVYRGTGFLIGPRAVATAGHCVYLHNQGGWARKVEVIPGANGSVKPHGSVESAQLRSVGGWVNEKKPQSDYGCVVVPPGSFGGTNLGSFAIGAMNAQALVAKPAVLAGYPGDKPFAEMWGMARKIKTVGPATLTYDIDTVGGQSGAPLYISRNGSRTVVGIHNYGSSSGNSATRVTPPVAQRLIAWSKL